MDYFLFLFIYNQTKKKNLNNVNLCNEFLKIEKITIN